MESNNRKQSVERLISLIERYGQVSLELRLSVGYSVESVFGALVNELFEMHVESVADAIGDRSEWLWWFILENDCGKKEHLAGFKDDMREICCVDDLFWLIDCDLNGVEVSA